MKTVLILSILAALGGCGIETASTAATAAALKKQETEQGSAALERVQQSMAEANRQTAQRAAQAEDANK